MKSSKGLSKEKIMKGSAKTTETKEKAKSSSERKHEKKDEDMEASSEKKSAKKEEHFMNEAMHYYMGQPMPPQVQAFYQKNGLFPPMYGMPPAPFFPIPGIQMPGHFHQGAPMALREKL
jgi:hypothetical protein